jgi:crotonobetainyl-CoA:carnitine CoA-transferase CaiB-like acyl-CoA transferase
MAGRRMAATYKASVLFVCIVRHPMEPETTPRLPLTGVRILDLSRLLPGGFCSQLLADLGADVIKVEDTGAGDYIRLAPPYYDGPEDSVRSALFLALNRNKRSIQLDLKSEGGRAALLVLVGTADVLLESFRPGVLDRLGLGYDRLAEANPGLIYCPITGYGLTGPNVARSGHDINYLALAGVLGLSGDADGPPVSAAGQIADLGGGALMAVVGILAALRERDGGGARHAAADPVGGGSGLGQVVDVSMYDGALSWLAMPAGAALCEGRSQRRGEFLLSGAAICYRPYRCADGWVSIGAVEPKFWAAWCHGVDRPELIQAQFETPGSEAHRAVSEIFASRTRAEWADFAAAHDCCLEPVLEVDEALHSELTAAREMVVELDQPDVEGPVRALGPPIKLSRTPADPRRRSAPALGADTREVLAEAGLAQAEIEGLLTQGAARASVATAGQPARA